MFEPVTATTSVLAAGPCADATGAIVTVNAAARINPVFAILRKKFQLSRSEISTRVTRMQAVGSSDVLIGYGARGRGDGGIIDVVILIPHALSDDQKGHSTINYSGALRYLP